MASVRLDRVRKVYDNDHVAVAQASFEIADGELLVLVGPSGCGKSTLLRMIAGLEDITSGELSIDGRVVNDLPPKARDIAMVFQSYALYPHMTVAQNLGFGLKLRGESKAQIAQKIHRAAGMLDLTSMLERKPRALSGGQRQRVALGRALVRDPKVFLLDEPLSNLDAKLRLSMRTEIARLHRQLGATMVYVTHDQVEAMTLGQRIVVLDHGAIQQIDTPMNLYRRPANLFVAGFLGSPAMNVFRGRLAREGGPKLVWDGGALPLDGLDPDARGLGDVGDRDVVIGLRPEDLRVDEGGDPAGDARIVASLELVEPIGNEVYLNLRHAGVPMIARVSPERIPEAGGDIALRFDARRVHAFDANSGVRIDGAREELAA